MKKIILFSYFFSLVVTQSALAQTMNQNTFVSTVDQSLTIKTILALPTTDNIDGIYAKPIDQELNQLINSDLQWSLTKFENNQKVKNATLDENPKSIMELQKNTGADAVLAVHLTKGARGINATMTLFTGRDGLALIQETLLDYKGFDVVDVRNEIRKMFQNLKSKLPYKAMVLSRKGQQVTINIGSQYGLKPNMNVTVIQIIKINRHPKLNFMISTEKEVLGRIQLTKVESNLSFGSIVFERDPGVVTVGGKIQPEDFIKYNSPIVTPDGKILPDLSERKDAELAFGQSPKEWNPEKNPQYGKIGILAGFSAYEQNSSIIGSDSITGKNGLAPNVAVNGEMWLSAEWYVGIGLRQSVFPISNSLANSSPSRLNMSMSQYSINAGYNFLLSNDFFGPKLQINGGFCSTKFSVDSSSPIAFTTMDYGGMLLGFSGQFPISEEIPLDLGMRYDMWLTPSLSESSSSGSSSNTVNTFGFFSNYHLRQNMQIRAELNFEYFKSDFSGTATRANPASGTSHKLSTLLVGVEYLF